MRAGFAILAFFLVAAPASAQDSSPRQASDPSIGFRVYAVVDGDMPAATKSFDATFGTSEMTAVGAGGEVDLWRRLFVRIAATRAQKTGTRVFVDAGEVFDLHIPTTVTLTPVEAGVGWRLTSGGRFAPYLGAAYVSLGYQQVSDFAEAGENLNERFSGGEAFGGVHVAIAKGFFVGAEGQYRRVTAPAAPRSLMTEFNEKDLGGVTGRVVIGFGTK